MTTTLPERRSSVTPDISFLVNTGADTISPIRTRIDEDEDDGKRTAWQELIEQTLLKWLDDPTQLEDEGIEAPTETMIRIAVDLAETWRDDKLLPPDSIVPDPNGGIVFERHDGSMTEVFQIWDDGTCEYQQFRGTKLLRRGTL